MFDMMTISPACQHGTRVYLLYDDWKTENEVR